MWDAIPKLWDFKESVQDRNSRGVHVQPVQQLRVHGCLAGAAFPCRTGTEHSAFGTSQCRVGREELLLGRDQLGTGMEAAVLES